MTSRTSLVLLSATVLVLLVVSPMASNGLWLGVAVGVALAIPSAALCARLDRRLRIGLVAIFCAALALRWIVAVVVDQLVYRAQPLAFAPDEGTYDQMGWYYAMYLKGMIPVPWDSGSARGVYRFVGACYYLFGHAIFVPKMIIGIAGAWSAVLTALIAERCFPAAVARRAGYLAAVVPSLVLWSSLVLKDTTTLVGAQLALYGFIRLREGIGVQRFVLLLVGLLLIVGDRPYEVIFVALTIAATFVLQSNRRPVQNLVLFGILSAVVVYIIRSSGADAMALGENNQSILERVTMLRSGYSEGVNSAMNVGLVDTSTPAGMIAWMPIGLAYFFLAPIPFTSTSIRSIATAPEMLAMYALIPALWRSLRFELRRRDRAFMTLFYYALLSSIGWSMVITNVGTIYRYRAQVLFVLLILVAAEQVRRREARLRPPARAPLAKVGQAAAA